MRVRVSIAARLLAVLAAGSLSLTACGSGSSTGGSSPAAGNELGLITPGTLTVCSDIPYPPFEFEKGGEYTGFDMDMIRTIADGLGLKTEIKDVGFDGLQSGASLAAGQCDLGASAITITEERKKNIGLSDPYYDSLQSLLVPADSAVKTKADLAGKKVGVQQGTTGEAYARKNLPSDAQILAYPSDAELFPALQSGNVDAVLQDYPVNLGHTEGGKYKIVEKYQTDEHYGFAVKKTGSEELLKAVNTQLAELKKNGKYQEIYDKYFTE
ncbi:basic amino acid ABC transporter substrate-binding protein [Arthrobacter sp. I2-34]|uniref:Basic amino acid ABC transporter substrate-binding protein n=1 Tax=Arthrobacter hankyongi TaxID=2904801 RepID=A0ABS9LAC8_9MICC|nr:basic amino acid ABC transporter substrate-binding protein [Arthrobacter hankyongi]MCG2623463.1 basic amino acid ABC transporter substrate-binding protein [Arthrobacter hankyongi]